MPVKRRLGKAREGAISDTAIALFEEMRQLGCSSASDHNCRCSDCEKWWSLHPHLRRALGGKMWEFPTISRHPPDHRRSYESDSEEARWLALEAASAARRQRAVSVNEPAPTAA
jgi:hypothetical protein